MRRITEGAWIGVHWLQRVQAFQTAAARWQSLVFGLPILLGIAFVFFLVPDTA
jgi:hypothetical protein